jgi:MHS family proline/betaine transporter-like MFS transporter
MNKQSFIITGLSSIVQYYDYHLFGFLAASIAKNFFPANNQATNLINTYLIMFIAVLAKPLGSVILGRIGDIFGRQKTIDISIFFLAVASLVISILPTFNTIGVASCLLLLIARMCIAAFASSGSDGARLYIYEKTNNKRKNFSSGLSTLFSLTGSFSASISAWFFTLNSMPEYFWRFAFLLGSVSGVVLIFLRKVYIDKNEDALLQQEDNYDTYKKMPLLKIIKQHFWLLFLCTIIAGGIGGVYQFNFIFLAAYNAEILQVIDLSSMQFYRSIGIIAYIIFSIISGILADKIGPRTVATVAATILIALSIFNCYLINNGKFFIEVYLLNSACLPLLNIPSLTLIKGAIPKVIRYRLFSLSHSLGSIAISGPMSLIATKIYQWSAIKCLPLFYFMAIVLTSIIAMNALSKIK